VPPHIALAARAALVWEAVPAAWLTLIGAVAAFKVGATSFVALLLVSSLHVH